MPAATGSSSCEAGSARGSSEMAGSAAVSPPIAVTYASRFVEAASARRTFGSLNTALRVFGTR